MLPFRRLSYVLALLSALPSLTVAQRSPGHPVSKVSVIGDLIHLELDSGVVSGAGGREWHLAMSLAEPALILTSC